MAGQTDFTTIRGLSAPARRALDAAGYTALEQLANAREKDIAALHGMGPKALTALREALAQRGLAFRTETPS